MEYIICRTSDHGWFLDENDKPKQPIEEAYLKTITETYQIADKSILPNDWYKKEFNHREEDNFCRRDEYNEVWMVNINSLDDLTKLCNKYNTEIIIGKYSFNPEYMQLEIYDDWRE